ncbi:MAG: hypothetical protein C5B49_11565 [Bdellovibrio sp.]|nr:MAG: hypothetical protein C5B49_11565 [Bdellovibrio sp.]
MILHASESIFIQKHEDSSMMKKLSDYQPFLTALLRSCTKEIHFTAREPLNEVLRQPRLVCAVNHSTPLSWIPPICLLTEKACEAGGGDRVPRGIIDKFFYSVPLLNKVAEYLTQSDHPQGFEEILQDFTGRERTDLVVFPEGALSFFGDLRQVQPFRSPRFLEIAVRARAPILLAVHHGTEEWNSLIPIPHEAAPYVSMVSKFFGRKWEEENFLNIPINFKRLERFSMATQLYRPKLTGSQLAEDPQELREQLAAECEKIRALMQSLYEDLAAKAAKVPPSRDSAPVKNSVGAK